ncbi:nuclear transport factor 2 family protein [Ahrensia kielensis]|uniref:Nuclear transport factor 2 family protein n=1 Tax=Ahrensia kielensis TaxID=76980 RepID=A0ABU9T684_9HYPH
MNRRTLLKTSLGTTLAIIVGTKAGAQNMDATAQASLDTVMAFMGAMGSGDMEKMSALMADDMVWHSEGDTTLPWIGETVGKEAIFKFLAVFSENLQTTKWENTDAFASGDTVAVFGRMNGVTTHSGKEIGEFTFALRAKVRGGQVVLWNWFEDSFAISQAYHG